MSSSQFKTRKVFEAMTVGEYLKKEREKADISIDNASEKLKIKKSYLKNLEEGSYDKLPPPVYIKGFIRSYANLLGLDQKKLVDLYNREIIINDKIKKETSGDIKKQNRRKDFATLNYFIPEITSKNITIFFSLAILSLIGYYLWYQINSFSSTPYLLIIDPSGNRMVDSPEMIIEGETETNTIVRINGEDVFVDPSGHFKENITLKLGKNVFIIEATNRFGKTAKEEVNIIYEKKPEPSPIDYEENINTENVSKTNNSENGQVNGSEDYFNIGRKMEVIGP